MTATHPHLPARRPGRAPRHRDHPALPGPRPVAGYITLDEALPRGLTISETSDAGSVPELAVINPLDDTVLLYDGEELVGAKQNRILNVSVLVGAGAKLPIPVSCVEQGRWNRSSVDFDSAAHISHSHLRRRKAEMLAAQTDGPRRRAERGVGGDRREAAADVGRLAHRREPRHLRGLRRPAAQARGRVPAPARPVRRRARDRRRPLPRHRLPARRLQRSSGRSSGPATCSTRSSGSTSDPADNERIAGFVDEVAAASVTRGPSAGLGEDVRLRGPGVIGSGLELDGEPIQLSAFTSDGGADVRSGGSPDRAEDDNTKRGPLHPGAAHATRSSLCRR